MPVTYRLTGDWMSDGVINNYNRRRVLEVVVDGGRMYDAELYGYPDDEGLCEIVGGEIFAWGAGVSFAPDDGELRRIDFQEQLGRKGRPAEKKAFEIGFKAHRSGHFGR